MASKKGSREKVDLKDNSVVKSPHFDLSNLPDYVEVNLPDMLRKSGAI